jgi:hypothetical protein
VSIEHVEAPKKEKNDPTACLNTLEESKNIALAKESKPIGLAGKLEMNSTQTIIPANRAAYA